MYSVKEIFYTFQGEGVLTGRPANMAGSLMQWREEVLPLILEH